MRKLSVLLGAFVIAVVAGCGIPQEKYDADIAALKEEVTKAQAALDETNAQLSSMQSEAGALKAQIKQWESDIARLNGESSENAKLVAQSKARLETFRKMLANFKSMIDSGKIKIKIVNNKMVVEMASEILFDSGKAQLSEAGEAALTELAKAFPSFADRTFQVAGHTDNIPIKNKKFKSNWDLSTARAIAVVEHLVANGVTPSNISGAGYADTQPATSNDTEEGRAQNRRIEIVLQPNLDELPDLSALESMVQ
jgi:chemotaxis protein MotB